jgi:predicted transcriptional regulator
MKERADVRLGKLELQIMKAVWARGKATVAEVQQMLPADRPRAYNTVLTMMRKLEAKGCLDHATEGRTFVYRARISQDNVRRGALRDLLDRVFDGSAQLLVSGLIDERRLTGAELKDIRALLDARPAAAKGKKAK